MGSKKIFFRVKKKIFLWVMAHWNYDQMTIKSMVIDHNFNFLIFQFFYVLKKWWKKMMLHLPNLLPPITKLQKNDFGKIKKTSPTKARTHTNSEIIPTQLSSSLTPSTKSSPPRCLHGNSQQKLFINKHFKLLNKGKGRV